ncbi:MAG: hypothetical protein DIU60_005925 [Actinomycetes bacterium]|nr:MAG: hypothetical protein DIU60_14580 [Actinomycetota bacterium]
MTALPSEPAGDRENETSGRSPLRTHPGDAAAVTEVLAILDAWRNAAEASREWSRVVQRFEASIQHSLGRARKVSVSLPEGLTEAVRQRVGKGEFSRYVAEAVARQLELDLLAELAELLEAEHGPVPEDLLAEAEAAWPDHG